MSDSAGYKEIHRLNESFSIDSLQKGDPREFSKVVDAYSGRLHRLVTKILNHPQDAEDVLQETFLKAFRSIRNFDGRSSISTWLYRIATNEALMLLRRKQPQTISVEEPDSQGLDLEQEPMQIIDWCCIPESELLSSEVRKQLDIAVEKLPMNLRTAFLLRDIEGLSTREAAEILEISETALKTRLSRARLRLRRDLSYYFSEKMDGNDGSF